MPDKSKVNFQIKRDTRVNAVHGWSRLAFGRRICKRTKDDVTPEEDSICLKKAKHNGRGALPGQLSARAAGTVKTRYLGTGTRGN